MLHVWCVSPLEIWHSSIQRKLCVIVMTSCHKTLYDCDETILLIVYSYLVFVGNGWLALVPSHLPHLRELTLEFCRNVCDKYIKELVAAVPGFVVVIKP